MNAEYDKGYQSGYDAGYKRAMLDYGLEDDKPCADVVDVINELVRHKQEVQNDFGWNITLQDALDMATESLKQKDFADFILHWLADMYGSACEYDYAGINTADYVYEHDNDFCEEGCGKHTDYDCWKKLLELKYQEHKREGERE